mmetsp:Transcript_31593/g.73662  ORF Transcript_31593/g.73662 Transcript_31593/m.73662 type:complete len:616 (+) Transcript_31593:146-1993(+)
MAAAVATPPATPQTAGSINSATTAAALTAATVLVAQRGALPPPCAPAGVRQPKWRLCFRMDRDAMSAAMANEVAWKHQRDFFVTVIDPPVSQQDSSRSGTPRSSPSPFFASDVACQLANLLVGRPFLMLIPGHSFSGRSVAALGKDCVAGGLVSAMLGAKVVFVCDRQLATHVRQNVQLYLKDTLDYTKTKCPSVTVASPGPSSSGGLDGRSLRDQLGAASLDVILATESATLALGGSSNDAEDCEPRLFEVFERLMLPDAVTKVLLICDITQVMSDESNDAGAVEGDGGGGEGRPSARWDTVPEELDVPAGWRVRPFCLLLRRFPVVWVERRDVERRRSIKGKKLPTPRQHLRPMGSSSSKCGFGGHPQRNFFDKVVNPEWQSNHHRLKEALASHNRIKQDSALAFMEEAMSWAQQATEADRDPAFLHTGGILSDMLARSTASLLSATASTRGLHDVPSPRHARAETADTCNASIASCDLNRSDGAAGMQRRRAQQEQLQKHQQAAQCQQAAPGKVPTSMTSSGGAGGMDTPGTPMTDIEDSRPNTAPPISFPHFTFHQDSGAEHSQEALPALPRTPRLPEEARWPRPARVQHTSYGLPYSARCSAAIGVARRT